MALEKSKVLKSAEKFVATGKIVQAIEEYEKILRESPKEWNVAIQVGDLYLKLNKSAEAIQNFQKVADHYYSDGFFLKAIAIYKRINKLDPNLTDICIRLADLYLKQGLSMDAKTQLQTVAHHYLSKNQNKDAIQTLQRLIEIEPENLKTRNDLARTYQKEGLIPEAIKEYLEISDQLARKNLLKESLAVLETGYKLDPRNTEILRKILTLYSEHHEPAKAAALLEEAVRLDPANPDVQALLATSLADRDELDKAHQSIDRAINSSAKKEPYWTVKGDIFLKSGRLEEAFQQYSKVVERFVQRKEDVDQAVLLMQKITKADVSFHQAWQRLTELFAMLRQQSNMIEAQTSLVDALISKNMYVEAAKNLEKLIKAEPEDSQHREKLKFVNSFIERTTPAYKPPETTKSEQPSQRPSKPATTEVRTPVPPSSSAPLRKPATAQSTGAHAQQPMTLSAVTSTAEPSSEEKDFVSEHLIEAEVFNKYGLIDKAVEQLQLIISKYPASVVSRQKLKEIYLEKGEREKAVEECVYMSRLFRKQGEFDQAEDLLSEARQINPNHPALDKAYKEIPPPPKAPDVLGEIEKLAQSIKSKSGSFRIPRPQTKPSTPPAAPALPAEPIIEAEIEIEVEEVEPQAETAAVLPEESFEEIDFYSGQGLNAEARDLLYSLKEKHPDDPGVLTRLAKLEPEKAAAPKDLSRMQPPPEVSAREEEVVLDMPEEAILIEPPAESEAQEEILIDLDEELTEAAAGEDARMLSDDMLLESEEAEQEISVEIEGEPTLNLGDFMPGGTVSEEQEEMERMEVSVSDEEMNQAQLTVEEDLSPTVFQELEDETVHSTQRASVAQQAEEKEAAEVEAESTPVIRTSEDLFEAEEDFFDLAAELEEGLLSVQSAVEEDKPADGQNYSLEQILSDFKKGVEKQLGAEDYDTRYNLGIAYKEMGLIDEAIAEFQIAAKDPKRFLECCSMLGLCFVEKGMPKLAVKWYQRGLETEGYSDEEYQGLRYDMAQAHEVSGEMIQALETYQEVYGMNANYRNVARKVKELQEQLRK